MIVHVDVEVLDAAGGGVVEAAVDVLVAEVAVGAGEPVPAEVDGEGEAVEAPPAAALERLEQPVRVVEGAVVEVEGGRRAQSARHGEESAPVRMADLSGSRARMRSRRSSGSAEMRSSTSGAASVCPPSATPPARRFFEHEAPSSSAIVESFPVSASGFSEPASGCSAPSSVRRLFDPPRECIAAARGLPRRIAKR